MSDLLSNTWAFIFALGVIIFVHEAGHLIVAKIFDTRVLTFSLGFGKRLWGFQRGETDYRVSLIPLGGYLAGRYAEADFHHQWLKAIEEQFGDKGRALVESGEFTLDRYCASPDGALESKEARRVR